MTIYTQCCSADCNLCWMSFMLSVASKPFILSVITLNVIVLSVVMLNVVAPFKHQENAWYRGKWKKHVQKWWLRKNREEDHWWFLNYEFLKGCHSFKWGETTCQVAAFVPAMFCNFYLVKYHKFAKNSTTTKFRDKNKHSFGILRILEKFWCMVV